MPSTKMTAVCSGGVLLIYGWLVMGVRTSPTPTVGDGGSHGARATIRHPADRPDVREAQASAPGLENPSSEALWRVAADDRSPR